MKWIAGCVTAFLLLVMAVKAPHTAGNATFIVDLPSGAARDPQLLPDGAVAFSIPSEPGGSEYLWFHFAVARLPSAVDFVLLNAAGAHQTGERWSITRPVFSADGRTWVRAEETSYSRQFSLKEPLGKPVFRFRAPLTAETLHVAYCYPYTLPMLHDFLAGLADRLEVPAGVLGQSEEGRDIPRFQIGGSSASDAGPEIWVICREHPGETPASYVLEGLTGALLDHPAGRRLRDRFTFHVVPLLNVDGAERGYYYHNARGVNLARDWSDFASAEARVLRQAMEPSLRRGTVRLVVN
ncbi:MAG: hypothetical protein C4524_05710, partial [Candidatus Zixiibacteriota bacterium]